MMESGSPKLYRWILTAAALLLASQPALAEKRVALVIGNSAYQNVAPLPNPANDGAKMAATLKDAGFDVVDSRRDLPAAETRRALRDFADRARDADIAVVYYAGHGIEVDGSNYLIPVDAKLERDTDIYDEAFSLDRILIAIEPAKKLRLVILDACRDNPFSKKMKRTVATRAVGQGLAKVEPTSPNVLIAYSAKAGSTAADGDGTNSPFTIALAHHLTTPGLDVRRAFGFVRDEVLKTTGNRQEPFVYGSLGGEDVPLVPAPARAAPAAAAASATPALSAQAEARRDYELALQIGNKSALNAFLAQYPDGFYASLAKLQLEKIAAEEARVAATEKARLTEQERARLAAEGAQKAQQAKAEADAKAAEQARIAAEKAKQVAQDQAAAAEQKRATAEKAAADKVAADKAVADKVVADKAAVDTASAAAPADKDKGVNLAALSVGTPQTDVTKSVQTELRRVGCLTGAADGDWNSASQRSLSQFNRYAGTKLDVKVASVDTLDAVKLKTSRVCPLVCEHGFKADGDRCSKISCAEGSFLNDDNECEKRREKKPVARRDRPEISRDAPEPRRVIVRRSSEPASPRGSSSTPGIGASGQPLTGLERQQGCNGYGAIMSGRCP
ncbi:MULTISPECIES: caspase family protein [unclassified Bradyrhizobium]|uniref:caspase family protein n=1 Tax=unclassified Bradyrhizobium TaxID=2631580 RepID=UPI001FEFC78E|nr:MULTISPECIES: caspase family protein [unclassified Bradyrhizobium]